MPRTKGAADVNERQRQEHSEQEKASRAASNLRRRRGAALGSGGDMLSFFGVAQQPNAESAVDAANALPTGVGGVPVAAEPTGPAPPPLSPTEPREQPPNEPPNGVAHEENAHAQRAAIGMEPVDLTDVEEDDIEAATVTTKASVMGNYLQLIFDRLRAEINRTHPLPAFEAKWLLEHLKENEWWLRGNKAEWALRKLGAWQEWKQDFVPAYFRDVFVWLPEERWHGMMPNCPTCGSSSLVVRHGFRGNNTARRVVSWNNHYFVISCRYKCNACQQKHGQLQRRIEAAASNLGLECSSNNTNEATDAPYTFMAWNSKSLELLAYKRGRKFPAFLTHRGGLSKSLIDWMRPLFNKGIRPTAFASTILELHAKRHLLDALEYEHEHRALLDLHEQQQGHEGNNRPAPTHDLFSAFGDKSKYAGCVPSGKYFSAVYKSHAKTIAKHLDSEVKKRGAERLAWDASYKEAKHLAQYHGKPLFHALITATNEVGEVRVQFHVVTDGHDQMVGPIKQLLETLNAYGQPAPQLLHTDKPLDDSAFFMQQMPSLQLSNNNYNSGLPRAEQATTTPTCTVHIGEQVSVGGTVAQVDALVDAMRGQVAELPPEKQIVSLDCEWDVHRNAHGYITGSGPVQWIQIGYPPSNGEANLALVRNSALLIPMVGRKKLHESVSRLLSCSNFTFVGSRVTADLKAIGRDFDCKAVTATVKAINLGLYARQRDVVTSGTASLDKLVELGLKKRMSKDVTIRCSKWSTKKLTRHQIEYAALDVIESLNVYHCLQQLPDLTARVTALEAIIGKTLDLVPGHGSVSVLATRAAIVEVVATDGTWLNPIDGCRPTKVKVTATRRLVKVTTVLAPNLKVPGLTKADGDTACLADFGQSPFCIPVKLSMLSHHASNARVFGEPAAGPVAEPPVEPPAEPAVEPPAEPAVEPTVEPELEQRQESCGDKSDDDEPGEDNDYEDLGANGIGLVRAAQGMQNQSLAAGLGEHLDPPPRTITDRYSSVCGDGFHYSDRPKVPLHHEHKKAYFVAFRDAWFQFDSKALDVVKKSLIADGKSPEDVEAMLYYQFSFFRDRAARQVPAASKLYWRVRRVYELFGPLVDSVSGKPLFNRAAWKKANNVLKEILAGHASDPPGVAFYVQRIDANGEPAVDRLGNPLLDCNRGSNRPENAHKQIVTTFGTWNTGLEMSDDLLREWRHRYNHSVSECRRLGFPILGHVDTWLVDDYQLIVEANHGVILYPEWSNASDFEWTEEGFGTVPLHSTELADAIAAIEVDLTKIKLTADQKYICGRMQVKLPLLPVDGKAECKLFEKLVLQQSKGANSTSLNFDTMATDWCRYADGVDIFPKLPVYLQQHHKAWQRNQRIKDAATLIEADLVQLHQLFGKQSAGSQHPAQRPPTATSQPTSAPLELESPHSQGPEHPAPQQSHQEPQPEPQPSEQQQIQRLPTIAIAQRVPMPKPPVRIIAGPGILPVVGGTTIGVAEPVVNQPTGKKRGRGPDKGDKRAGRSCYLCRLFAGEGADWCTEGRGGRVRCRYFFQDGSPKEPDS